MILTKFICMQKIEVNQSMNVWLKGVMIKEHLLSVQIQWIMFMKIFIITTHAEKKRFNCVWWHDHRHYDK